MANKFKTKKTRRNPAAPSPFGAMVNTVPGPKPKVMPAKLPPMQPNHPRLGMKNDNNMTRALKGRK